MVLGKTYVGMGMAHKSDTWAWHEVSMQISEIKLKITTGLGNGLGYCYSQRFH